MSLYFGLAGLYSVPHVSPLLACPGSSPLLLIPFQSLISLAKFTLGTECWGQFASRKAKVELRATRERHFSPSRNYAHYRSEIISLSYRTPSIFLVPFGMVPSALYIFYCGPKKPILLTNILALSFGHDAMSALKVDSFKTGSILLSGLFLYDIWWVFGTTVVCDICHSPCRLCGGR
jgi:hypothetical protein